MRISPLTYLSVVAVALAACGDNDGAVLTFVAPDGVTATRIELVLANADTAKITASDQRIRPGGLAEEEVVYYRQRATGGAIEIGGAVHGFELRIAPDEDVADEDTFVPFALLFNGDELTAVGFVAAADGTPHPVMIRAGALVNYTLTVQPIAVPGGTTSSDAGAIAVGEGQVVRCATPNVGQWRSGVAWRPAVGSQLRLLLPDRSVDAAATDASGRAADLDCDLHDARQDDCDDLRIAFHDDQVELCDGLDTNCDGKRVELMEGCTLPPTMCGGQGVSFCYDLPGAMSPAVEVACQPDAVCACQGQPGSCAACSFDYTLSTAGGALEKTPCAPAMSKLDLPGSACSSGEPCTIEVVRVDGPFSLKLSTEASGPYARTTMNTNNWVYLQATYLGPPTTMPGATSLGAAYLAVTTATRLVPVTIDLTLANDGSQQCQPSNLPGAAVLHCRP